MVRRQGIGAYLARMPEDGLAREAVLDGVSESASSPKEG